MIVKKIKQIVNEFRLSIQEIKTQNKQILAQNLELEWAHIYTDTAKGIPWLSECGISPGRWAGNYSFFYVLARILSDYQPQKILELGLGESSKVVSSYMKYVDSTSKHLIVEQSLEWISGFNSRHNLSNKSATIHCELEKKQMNGYEICQYKDFKNKIIETFDLYIIDGPFGSDRYSRYDICLLAQEFKKDSEFIILFDDYNRIGEQDTVKDLLEILHKKGMTIHTGIFSGNDSQFVISTNKYKYASSM